MNKGETMASKFRNKSENEQISHEMSCSHNDDDNDHNMIRD